MSNLKNTNLPRIPRKMNGVDIDTPACISGRPVVPPVQRERVIYGLFWVVGD